MAEDCIHLALVVRADMILSIGVARHSLSSFFHKSLYRLLRMCNLQDSLHRNQRLPFHYGVVRLSRWLIAFPPPSFFFSFFFPLFFQNAYWTSLVKLSLLLHFCLSGIGDIAYITFLENTGSISIPSTGWCNFRLQHNPVLNSRMPILYLIKPYCFYIGQHSCTWHTNQRCRHVKIINCHYQL